MVSTSQDYAYLAGLLFRDSARYARRCDGNVSIYTFAGIPLLFSTLRALLIECNDGIYGKGRDANVLARLEKDRNELSLLKDRYLVGDDVLQDLGLLRSSKRNSAPGAQAVRYYRLHTLPSPLAQGQGHSSKLR